MLWSLNKWALLCSSELNLICIACCFTRILAPFADELLSTEDMVSPNALHHVCLLLKLIMEYFCFVLYVWKGMQEILATSYRVLLYTTGRLHGAYLISIVYSVKQLCCLICTTWAPWLGTILYVSGLFFFLWFSYLTHLIRFSSWLFSGGLGLSSRWRDLPTALCELLWLIPPPTRHTCLNSARPS
jgi:hypothetical protein